MRLPRLLLPLVTAVVLAAAPALADKIPPAFRSAFEREVHKGAYGVVVQKNVPTTSVYGIKGDQTTAYYSVDIKGGEWQTSEGWLDLNQVAVDALTPGEVMEIVDVSYKDTRIDVRLASVEAHRVTRGSGFLKTTRREPVSTNFKFFFPFPVADAGDLQPVMQYLESFIRVFPNESAARTFSGQLMAGGTAPPRATARASSAMAPAATTTHKEIKAGMSMLEVIDILGKPQKEVSFESKTRWTYPDLTVIFENGRVKQVQF